jgi:hypothetical protein
MSDRGFRHASAVLALLAAAGLTICLMSQPPGSYVSEAGVAGAPHFVLYRASVVAAGLSAAALAVGLFRPFALAAVALIAAAPAIIASATVSCTPGCPLPPHEVTTARDLVHAAASTIGVGCCALAMLALARTATGPLRRLSRLAVFAAWPLLLATAACMLTLGRGPATGVFERLGILACLAWIVATAATPSLVDRPASLARRGSAVRRAGRL